MHLSKRSLRFRGHQDDQGNIQRDLMNLEQQPLTRQQRVKGLSGKMIFFKTPDKFFSWTWVPFVWVLLCLLYLGLMILLVGVVHSNLPAPEVLEDSLTVKDNSRRFIAGQAQYHLNALIKNGPRPVGSNENEIYARNFIESEVLKIKEKSTKTKILSLSDQVVSGSFYVGMVPQGYISVYHNVQNFIVRLSSSHNRTSSAVLVNCHFDSVPGSPGASDDGFHCAVMLELLRVLSQSEEPLLHDIIFLFNGAEESGLQASHGFITHHEWAKDVKTFVNLEACGAAGKEVLFQAGPNCPWLVETYAKAVPHPHGTVIAEELFQSGIIPSDTDFRIFRDFGHIPGVDFANSDNGFVYHTKFDNGALVSLGSYQHTGDNMLAFLQALANSPLLDDVNLFGGSMVYFDFLGLWLVHYSHTTGIILNYVISFVSLGTIFIFLLKYRKVLNLSLSELTFKFGCAVSVTVGSWVLAGIYIFILSLLLNLIHLTQSWYRSYFYLFTLYYCSTIFFCVMAPFLVANKRSKLSNVHQSQINSLATQFIWTVLLLAATALNMRSSYLFLILILSPTVGNILLICSRNNKTSSWVVVQFLQTVIPLLIGIYHTIMVMSVFIPITNRSGSGLNAELAIGLLSAATCILNISYLIPLSLFMRHISVIVSLATVHLIGLLVLLIANPLPFYEWETGESGVLERVPLWHVERSLFDESGDIRYSDSGFWMINMDPSSPYLLKRVVEELNSAEKASEFCGNELFCALPVYSPRMANWINDSIWIRANKPFESSILQVDTHIDETAPHIKRVTFNISGPNQMNFMLSPLPGVSVTGWSLQAELKPSTVFKGRPAYFLFYQRGLPATSWFFYIDFKIDPSRNLSSSSIATVSVVGSHISSDYFSSHFKQFIEKFPKWAFVSPRASELRLWVL